MDITETVQIRLEVIEQDNSNTQADTLLRHARTMCMMYQATNNSKYLAHARQDIRQAKSLLRSGFVRPLGVLLFKSA